MAAMETAMVLALTLCAIAMPTKPASRGMGGPGIMEGVVAVPWAGHAAIQLPPPPANGAGIWVSMGRGPDDRNLWSGIRKIMLLCHLGWGGVHSLVCICSLGTKDNALWLSH